MTNIDIQIAVFTSLDKKLNNTKIGEILSRIPVPGNMPDSQIEDKTRHTVSIYSHRNRPYNNRTPSVLKFRVAGIRSKSESSIPAWVNDAAALLVVIRGNLDESDERVDSLLAVCARLRSRYPRKPLFVLTSIPGEFLAAKKDDWIKLNITAIQNRRTLFMSKELFDMIDASAHSYYLYASICAAKHLSVISYPDITEGLSRGSIGMVNRFNFAERFFSKLRNIGNGLLLWHLLERINHQACNTIFPLLQLKRIGFSFPSSSVLLRDHIAQTPQGFEYEQDSFQRLAIVSLLLGISEKKNRVVIQQAHEGRLIPLMILSDSILNPSFRVRANGKIYPGMTNSLYFRAEMDKPLSQPLKDHITRLCIPMLLCEYLQDLTQQNINMATLGHLPNPEFQIPIKMRVRDIKSLYVRLLKLQKLCRERPDITLNQIYQAFYPSMFQCQQAMKLRMKHDATYSVPAIERFPNLLADDKLMQRVRSIANQKATSQEPLAAILNTIIDEMDLSTVTRQQFRRMMILLSRSGEKRISLSLNSPVCLQDNLLDEFRILLTELMPWVKRIAIYSVPLSVESILGLLNIRNDMFITFDYEVLAELDDSRLWGLPKSQFLRQLPAELAEPLRNCNALLKQLIVYAVEGYCLPNLIQYAISQGIDIHALGPKVPFVSLFNVAVYWGNIPLAQYLVQEFGDEVAYHTDESMNTALHIVLKRDHLKLLGIMVRHEALGLAYDRSRLNNQGESVWDLAKDDRVTLQLLNNEPHDPEQPLPTVYGAPYPSVAAPMSDQFLHDLAMMGAYRGDQDFISLLYRKSAGKRLLGLCLSAVLTHYHGSQHLPLEHLIRHVESILDTIYYVSQEFASCILNSKPSVDYIAPIKGSNIIIRGCAGENKQIPIIEMRVKNIGAREGLVQSVRLTSDALSGNTSRQALSFEGRRLFHALSDQSYLACQEGHPEAARYYNELIKMHADAVELFRSIKHFVQQATVYPPLKPLSMLENTRPARNLFYAVVTALGVPEVEQENRVADYMKAVSEIHCREKRWALDSQEHRAWFDSNEQHGWKTSDIVSMLAAVIQQPIVIVKADGKFHTCKGGPDWAFPILLRQEETYYIPLAPVDENVSSSEVVAAYTDRSSGNEAQFIAPRQFCELPAVSKFVLLLRYPDVKRQCSRGNTIGHYAVLGGRIQLALDILSKYESLETMLNLSRQTPWEVYFKESRSHNEYEITNIWGYYLSKYSGLSQDEFISGISLLLKKHAEGLREPVYVISKVDGRLIKTYPASATRLLGVIEGNHQYLLHYLLEMREYDLFKQMVDKNIDAFALDNRDNCAVPPLSIIEYAQLRSDEDLKFVLKEIERGIDRGVAYVWQNELDSIYSRIESRLHIKTYMNQIFRNISKYLSNRLRGGESLVSRILSLGSHQRYYAKSRLDTIVKILQAASRFFWNSDPAGFFNEASILLTKRGGYKVTWLGRSKLRSGISRSVRYGKDYRVDAVEIAARRDDLQQNRHRHALSIVEGHIGQQVVIYNRTSEEKETHCSAVLAIQESAMEALNQRLQDTEARLIAEAERNAELANVVDELHQALEQKDQALEQKDQALEQKDQENARLRAELEEFRRGALNNAFVFNGADEAREAVVDHDQEEQPQ